MDGGHRPDGARIVGQLREWGQALGFSQIGVVGIDLGEAEAGLREWLSAGFHGTMGYMAAHGAKRARPAELVPGTVSVITARMDYLPSGTPPQWIEAEQARLADPTQAIVSVYTRGRDYHKVLRGRLKRLARQLEEAIGPFGHRVFTDSAPVLEVELAVRSGLGWRGCHTLALSREAGSTFFLGEVFTDLTLPPTEPVQAHCGNCTACIVACPTQAIVAPYRLDARRCIAYLTLELEGEIPLEFRRAMGRRIAGCDDCQLACPWNKYAQRATVPDFEPRHGLEDAALLALWGWDEAGWLERTEGSALRRIGWTRWRRNLAVALGNALRDAQDAAFAVQVAQALRQARPGEAALVQAHIDWALAVDA